MLLLTYGYDSPKTKKPPTRTCNCLPKWCCCCGGKKKKKKTNKPKSELKKRNSSKVDVGGHVPVCALEGIVGKYFAFRKRGVQKFSHPAMAVKIKQSGERRYI